MGNERQASKNADGQFFAHQEHQRKRLRTLLGELPWDYRPGSSTLIDSEDHEGYRIERLELDLNGVEPVPAILLIPNKRVTPAPGLLFIHWHAGMFDLGKEQLLQGVDAQRAYAPTCVEKGLVTLAIDSWCFGQRKHERIGRLGEENTFKQMLWNGQVLFGMMMFDELRAFDYLASRPEVDAHRLGVLGMSMGGTKAWWLAALEPRVKLCVDICSLTDYDELIRSGGLGAHGLYYYVPSLLKHFRTPEINELIVPRARLSLNGRRDLLTPANGIRRIQQYLEPLYQRIGSGADCHIEVFDCDHVELPAMRKLIEEWMNRI